MNQLTKDEDLFVAVKRNEVPMTNLYGRYATVDPAPGVCMRLSDYPIQMFQRNELRSFYDFDNPQSIYGYY